MTMTLCRGMLAANDLWWLDRALAWQLPDPARAEPVYEGTYTRIWRHPDRDRLVSKLSWRKTAPRDNLRKYWACQALREITANRTMQRLGIPTAELLGYGIPVAPWARLESVLFMRELPENDTMRVVLRATTDPARRAALLDRVASHVAAIYANGYHHKDCHLENVLQLRGSGQLIWVDNDLRHCARPRKARRRLAASLRQLVDTSPGFISTAEWGLFAQSLNQHLRRTDLGRELAATTVTEFEGAFVS